VSSVSTCFVYVCVCECVCVCIVAALILSLDAHNEEHFTLIKAMAKKRSKKK